MVPLFQNERSDRRLAGLAAKLMFAECFCFRRCSGSVDACEAQLAFGDILRTCRLRLFPRHSSFPRNIAHATGSGDDSKRIGYKRGIATLKRIAHVNSNGLVVIEIFRWIKQLCLDCAHFVSFASLWACLMSLSCVLCPHHTEEESG
jgi:hypothetical protein